MEEIRKRKHVNTIIQLLLIAVVLAGVILCAGRLSSKVDLDRRDIMQDSIRRYVVQCYALEGFYPRSLSYLENNYTLTLDRSKYVYHYKFIGYNMMPEIAVFEKNE